MSDRTDYEIRVYLTGREDGTIEWFLTVLEPDGQSQWIDQDISRNLPYAPVAPVLLGKQLETTLRHLCYRLRSNLQLKD